MPSPSYLTIFELLTRHGVPWQQAKSLAMNELRAWEVSELEGIFKKVTRPNPDFLPFASGEDEVAQSSTADGPKWITPSRELMRSAVTDHGALCINVRGEWRLQPLSKSPDPQRSAGASFVALSHAWSEGLQRNTERDGLESVKVRRIFATLKSAGIEAEWIWTDVLAIPVGAGPLVSVEDEMLITDVINMMPDIYSNASSVVIFDALTLQLDSEDMLDVAVTLPCGRWVTRVWTYQEVKLAKRALVATRCTHFDLHDIENVLDRLEKNDYPRFHHLRLFHAILSSHDEIGVSVTDIAWACKNRQSGQDIDYARAFFPVLGLKWEYGMTKEEGMQQIYWSQNRNASTLASFFGTPRLLVEPAWAPSVLVGLEGTISTPLDWERRGVRGEWKVLALTAIQHSFAKRDRRVFNFTVAAQHDTYLQCTIHQNEARAVDNAITAAVEEGTLFVLSRVDFWRPGEEFAESVLLVRKATIKDHSQFEASVLCAAKASTSNNSPSQNLSILLRHGSPYVNSDLTNESLYLYEQQFERARTQEAEHQGTVDPVHQAIRQGDVTKLESLLTSGHAATVFDVAGWTPLHIAAARGEGEMLDMLLPRCPVDIPGDKGRGRTPLSLAVFNGQSGVLESLLEYGADINTTDNLGWTPLMNAARNADATTARKLIALGAPLEYAGTDEEERTPLGIAAGARGALKIVEILLEAGAEINGAPKPSKTTPLHAAIRRHRNDVALLLIERGADVNARENDTSHTPLKYAIENGNVECVRRLLDAGADQNAIFQNNWTPIHFAASSPKWEILKMLLDKAPGSAVINVQTSPDGFTPLHLALALRDQGKTHIKLLLKAGAQLSLEDSDGFIPVECAVDFNCRDSFGLLWQAHMLDLSNYQRMKERLDSIGDRPITERRKSRYVRFWQQDGPRYPR